MLWKTATREWGTGENYITGSDVYCSPDIMRAVRSRRCVLLTRYYEGCQIKEGKTCGPYGTYTRGLGGNTRGKRPLGKPRFKWENITMDIKDVGLGARTGLIWLKTGTNRGLLVL